MIEENVSLQPYNTFGIESTAAYFCSFDSIPEAVDILKQIQDGKSKQMVLGGGSNILLIGDYDGFVLKNNIPGKEIVYEDEQVVHVKVGAGENWHAFVTWSVESGYGGLENLSLIPGQVGASPMQNIGAYGVEIKDRFVELTAVDRGTGNVHQFNAQACKFGYRESVFKRELKDQYIITDVTYALSKVHQYNTAYGAIESELERMGIESLSPKAISDAVINIRESKLPDPAKIGNSGSFFKNPVTDEATMKALKAVYPDMPTYPLEGNRFKIAAGWLIEKAGWKGKKVGACGVHANQALVLVNHGGASGNEIFKLSEEILISVQDKFGLTLEREVNIIK